MMKDPRFLPCLLAAIAAVMSSGCGATQPARLYVLRTPDPIPVRAIHHEHLQGAQIAVATVRIPKHLDRPSIVTQAGHYELAHSEFQRWGSPLSDNLTEVLTDSLTALLPGSLIWPKRGLSDIHSDYTVIVRVQSLTGRLGEEVSLVAHWSIVPHPARVPVSLMNSRYNVSLTGSDYAAYSAGISGLVLELARDISGALEVPPPVLQRLEETP